MIKIRLRYWGLKRRLPFKNQPIFLLSGVFIFVFKYFTLFKYIWIISVFTNSICIRFKLQNKYYLVFVFVPKSLFVLTLLEIVFSHKSNSRIAEPLGLSEWSLWTKPSQSPDQSTAMFSLMLWIVVKAILLLQLNSSYLNSVSLSSPSFPLSAIMPISHQILKLPFMNFCIICDF